MADFFANTLIVHERFRFGKRCWSMPVFLTVFLIAWSAAMSHASIGDDEAGSSSRSAVYSATDLHTGKVTNLLGTKRNRSGDDKHAVLSADYRSKRPEKDVLVEEFKKMVEGGEFVPQRVSQAGISSADETARPPRSHSDDEIRQIERQITSQLYAAAREKVMEQRRKSQNTKRKNTETIPVEIEMMIDEKRNLYISANKNATLKHVWEVVDRDKGFTKALTKQYGTTSSMIGRRSRNDSSKLNKMISGGSRRDRKPNASAIFDIVVNATELHKIDLGQLSEKKDPTVLNHIRNEKGGQIYLVYGKNADEGRHAEEKLMDLVEHIGDEHKHFTVGGKKRPCISCFGRMLYTKQVKGFDITHGENPGRLWIGRWKEQSSEVFKFTFENVIKGGTTNVTRYIDEKGREYLTAADDSQSNTDSEGNVRFRETEIHHPDENSQESKLKKKHAK